MYIVQRRQARHCAKGRKLTVKLSGRPEAANERRGRTMSSRARRAEPPAVHGPLQRLLGGGRTPLLNRSHLKYRVRMIVGDIGMHELTS